MGRNGGQMLFRRPAVGRPHLACFHPDAPERRAREALESIQELPAPEAGKRGACGRITPRRSQTATGAFICGSAR